MNFDGFDVFGEKAAIADADRVLVLDAEQFYPDPKNVRTKVDKQAIADLAETIKERGQLQPITVAPKGSDGRYMIRFGERRWRACKSLGIHVRAIVKKADDDDHAQIDQFIENDQREDLSTADMIRFVSGEVAKGRSLAELARATGRNRSHLSRYQGLASAPDFVAALFDKVSMRSAVALAQAARVDESKTRAFIVATPADDMTVLACEKFARSIGAIGTVKEEQTADVRDKVPTEPQQLEPPAPTVPTEVLTPAPAPPAPAVVKAAPEVREAERTPANEGSRSGSRETAKPGQVKERPVIEIDGRRALVVEALVHFDDEQEPRVISWR